MKEAFDENVQAVLLYFSKFEQLAQQSDSAHCHNFNDFFCQSDVNSNQACFDDVRSIFLIVFKNLLEVLCDVLQSLVLVPPLQGDKTQSSSQPKNDSNRVVCILACFCLDVFICYVIIKRDASGITPCRLEVSFCFFINIFLSSFDLPFIVWTNIGWNVLFHLINEFLLSLVLHGWKKLSVGFEVTRVNYFDQVFNSASISIELVKFNICVEQQVLSNVCLLAKDREPERVIVLPALHTWIGLARLNQVDSNHLVPQQASHMQWGQRALESFNHQSFFLILRVIKVGHLLVLTRLAEEVSFSFARLHYDLCNGLIPISDRTV